MSFALPDVPVRWHPHEDRVVRVMAAMADDHPMAQMPCLACGEAIADGNAIVLLALGPGDDPKAREACQHNRWHTACGIVLHAACAGKESP